MQYGVVQGLSFYEMRWILKFSFKHHFMNKTDIFNFVLNEIEKCLNDISNISFKAVSIFKQ
jgi:hypothetical protein